MDRYPSETAQAVLDFHEAFDLPIDVEPTEYVRDGRLNLLSEEFLEASEELMPEKWATGFNERWDDNPAGQKARLAKELADLVIVAYGTALAIGIDLDEALRIVNRSNMTKLWDDGKPRYREDGKVLKPPTYVTPDMTEAVL